MDSSASNSTSGSHLSPDQLASLEAQIERQVARLQRAAGAPVDELERDSDPLDVAATISLYQTQAVTQARSAAEVIQWRQALRRLREHPSSYGRCASCNHPIPFERLDLLPTTTSCVRC